MGVESANDKTLKFFNKGYNIEQVNKSIEIIKEHKIELHGYFIIGSPTEGKQETMNTINFAINKPFDYALFSILTPVKNTKLMYMALENGWIDIKDINSEKTKGFCYPTLKNPEMTPEEILKIYKSANIMFFVKKPKRIINLIGKLLGKSISKKLLIKTMVNYVISKK